MATKSKTKDDGDAPLIDLNEASIKKLITKAKRKGYVTYDELNDALPQGEMSSDQIEDIQSALSDMGVQIVESDEEAEAAAEEAEEVEEIAGAKKDTKAAAKPAAKKTATGERTDDPVRMYLREMGAVELLSREGEIAIAKRIEAGRENMIGGLCESPLTMRTLIEWRDEIVAENMLLRDVIDLESTYGKPEGPSANDDSADDENSDSGDAKPNDDGTAKKANGEDKGESQKADGDKTDGDFFVSHPFLPSKVFQ